MRGVIMKYIKLTQGKQAIVDDEDFGWLNQWKWQTRKTPINCYAHRTESRRTIIMHRLIMNPPPEMQIDHINHDGLDNRRCNLRICTSSQNNRNQRPRKASSQYKGVSWYKDYGKWEAYIQENGKQKRIGYFNDEVMAAKAYDQKAVELYREFACLNFPTPSQKG
jgi:hypothetical protein